jgi:hypothetical protein
MKNQNRVISGNSMTAQFIRQNIEELVERKTSILNYEKGYIYLHKDGDFQSGSNDQFGQSSVYDFGGYCNSSKEAIEKLQYMIDTEPYEFSNDLKGYINNATL